MNKQNSNRGARQGYGCPLDEKPTFSLLRSRHSSRSQHSSPMASSGLSFEQSFCSSKYSGVKSKRSSLMKQSQKCSQCMSHRSSSRQKILEGKIDHMLKEQEGKIIEITNNRNANQIKFVNCKIIVNKEAKQNEQISTMRSRRKVFDEEIEENKENFSNLNRQQRLQPNLTQKSNKLSLRNYLNNTNSLEQKLTISQDLLSLTSSKKDSVKGDIVLQEVRQLKSMFRQIMNNKQNLKTRKKPNLLMKNWEEQQFQNLTLP